MNPLQSIPPVVRKWAYLVYALVGLVLGGLQVYGVANLGALDVSKSLEVLAYIGIPLGFTAASNLPSYEDVVEGDAAPPRDQLGVMSLERVLVIVILGLFALFLLLAVLPRV